MDTNLQFEYLTQTSIQMITVYRSQLCIPVPKRRLKLRKPRANQSGFFEADEIEVGIGACHDLHPSEVQNKENIFSVF